MFTTWLSLSGKQEFAEKRYEHVMARSNSRQMGFVQNLRIKFKINIGSVETERETGTQMAVKSVGSIVTRIRSDAMGGALLYPFSTLELPRALLNFRKRSLP
jgi:hypothetical protein